MKTLIPTTALVVLYSCAPAWADTGTAPRSVTVRFEDLNINSARGAAQLYHRIEHAAEDVCGGNPAPLRLLKIESVYASCVRGAVSGAVARVNHPAVTAYAAAHGIVPAHVPMKVKFASNE
jgi:UrcA family protein